jgi:hypothetical protein
MRTAAAAVGVDVGWAVVAGDDQVEAAVPVEIACDQTAARAAQLRQVTRTAGDVAKPIRSRRSRRTRSFDFPRAEARCCPRSPSTCWGSTSCATSPDGALGTCKPCCLRADPPMPARSSSP